MKYYKYSLKEKMKNGEITAAFLQQHRDIKNEILKQDLAKITSISIRVQEEERYSFLNACEVLSRYFSKEEIYHLMVSYGAFFDKATLFIKNPTSSETVYNDILDCIKEYMYENKVEYEDVLALPQVFKDKYKEIILDDDVKEEIKKDYYYHQLDLSIFGKKKKIDYFFKDVYPYIKDKDLTFGIKKKSLFSSIYEKIVKVDYLDMERTVNICVQFSCGINVHKINEFLWKNADELIVGDYETNASLLLSYLKNDIIEQLEDLEAAKVIKEELYDLIGDIKPEFFLDFDAPETLKNSYYQKSYPFLSIYTLASHKEWGKYLINKDFYVAMKDDEDHLDALMVYRSELTNEEFFDILHKNSAVLESCCSEMEAKKVVAWYKKYKFVPHYGVVKNFSIEEMDKFISSSRKWSRIVKLEKISEEFINDDKMDALVKAAYTFGVFDNDDKGYNTLIKFLYDLPKELPINYNIPTTICYDTESFDKYLRRYYKESEDTLQLRNDLDMYSEEVQVFRKTVAQFRGAIVFEHRQLHPIFGGFSMKYDPYFRDFFVENYNDFYEKHELSLIVPIQRRFSEIRAFNSNRVIDYNVVIDYVKKNNYMEVDTGNYSLAEVASKVGYSEKDFQKLQDIFLKTKLRTFNTIPRIVGTYKKYTYEMLRLDDPLALVIGVLTDCCQALHAAAESSMIHSATDKNGRVFVVYDDELNITAQSWVWRSGNVLCFDNVEIPEKAFKRCNNQSVFVEDILNIYQQASRELLELDNKTYKKLIEEKQLNKKEKEEVKLAKITVGLGYNDIAEAIKKNLKMDVELCTPIRKSKNPLYTDSSVQYILSSKEKIPKTELSPYELYKDDYRVYSELNQKEYLFLTCLTSIYSHTNTLGNWCFDDYIKAVQYAYETEEDIKILMNYNFAIVYNENDENITIYDILINNTLDKDVIALQYSLGIEQLKSDKNILFDREEENIINKQLMKKLDFPNNK